MLSRAPIWLMAGLALASLMLTGDPAKAQDAAYENEEEGNIICLAIGYRWSGTNEERKQIKTTPVPASFLRALNAGGCASWQLLRTSLLDWHLKHGDAQSAYAAVRFLERHFDADLGPTFAEEFIPAWETAISDGQNFLNRKQVAMDELKGARWFNEIEPGLMRLKSVERLSQLANRLESAQFVAGEYTRGADTLLSRTLFDGARRIDTPLAAATRFIDERETLGGLEEVFARRYRPDFRTDRLSTRVRAVTLSVLDALLTRDEPSILAAHTVTQQYYNPSLATFAKPDMQTFLERAYEGDDKACIADELNSRKGYEERCEDENLEHFALIFWYQRARLELLAREAGVGLPTMRKRIRPRDHTKSVIDLFVRRAWYQGARYSEEPYPAEAIRLLIGLAKTEASELPASCPERWSEEEKAFRSTLYDSKAAISRALTLASPSTQLPLYREVALARIELQATYEVCTTQEEYAQFARDLILARAFLGQYDALIALE